MTEKVQGQLLTNPSIPTCGTYPKILSEAIKRKSHES